MEHSLYLSIFGIGILLGTIIGIFGVHSYQIRKTKRLMKNMGLDKNGEFFKKLEEDLSERQFIEDKLRKADEIQRELIDLAMAQDEPQRNSLDGRHRGRQYGKFKQLEDEMNSVLQSILDDGYDPELACMNDAGDMTSMKLSELMKQRGFIGSGSQDDNDNDTKSGPMLRLVEEEKEEEEVELPPLPDTVNDDEKQ